MNRKKHLKWMASLLIVMLAGACSTGEDEEMLLEQSINIPDTDNASTSVPKLMYRFRGIWTVDEVSADTTRVRVATAQPRSSVEFHGFPIKAMMKRMLQVSAIVDKTGLAHSLKRFFFINNLQIFSNL